MTQSNQNKKSANVSQVADRRPLASRNTSWAKKLAAYLASTSISPNQISYASVGFAGLAAVAMVLSNDASTGAYVIWMLVAILGCQLRLVCNLMDGMVAIEAGKQTPDGALWNEFPDRLADIIIIASLGIAAGWPVIGWAAATSAVLVAYIRELGKGIDGVVDFTGPMAKPHRMALISGGLALAAVSKLSGDSAELAGHATGVLRVVLVLLVAGCLITIVRRVRGILGRLA